MIDPLEILTRLALAAVFGGIIGANRGRLEWAAGLRTHMLVSVGAALAMIVSAFGFADVLGQPNVVLDPSRIAAQVISGVGFLGAGTILFLQREQVIRGLTTAAGLWAVSAIGLAAGSGLFIAASITTALIWVILALLKPIERRFIKARNPAPRLIARFAGTVSLGSVQEVLSQHQLTSFRTKVRRDLNTGEDILDILLERSVPAEKLTELSDSLRRLDGMRSVSFRRPGAPRTPTD